MIAESFIKEESCIPACLETFGKFSGSECRFDESAVFALIRCAQVLAPAMCVIYATFARELVGVVIDVDDEVWIDIHFAIPICIGQRVGLLLV